MGDGMGRSEGPLDPSAGPVQRFAFDLRKLRQEAGGLTYRAMAQCTDYSVATLSRAAAGGQLPSLEVALAYVRACGADPEEWEPRWRAVAREVEAEPEDADDTDAPYRGLTRFEPGDRHLFFGRDQLVARLTERVRVCRMVAVVGASGSGKSSLLRAGLLPSLQDQQSSECRLAAIRILTPGPRPASTHSRALTASQDPGDTVVVVDQFEELFTLCSDPAERAAFLDLLVKAVEPENRLRVVIAVRADFLSRCADHRPLAAALTDATFLLGPMGPAELRDAIVKPAAAAGLIVERTLTARIVEDVAEEPGGLPLMSHALLETWRRRRGRTLTLAAYEAAGGVHGALTRTAEELYTRLSPERADVARRILLRLITPGEGAQDTSRPAEHAELQVLSAAGQSADTASVLEQLARARLVTLDGDMVHLAHEALITAWPRLQSWIDGARERLRVHRQLTEATRAWDALARDPGALYRGTRLVTAEECLTGYRADLTPSEAAFLDASIAAREQERRVAARTARRIRALLAAVSALLLVASTVAVIAFQQRSLARAGRDRAVAEQVVAEAGQLNANDPSLAARMYVAAYRLRSDRGAAAGLLDTQNTALSSVLSGHTQAVYAVAFSPDGRTLATGAGDDTIRLWSLADPAHPVPLGRPLTGHTDWVYWLQFSPDGHTLASASRDRTARLWDVRDPAHPKALGRPLTGHPDFVFSVSFSRDGRTLVTASQDHTVRLWDVSDPAHAKALGYPLTGAQEAVASAALSPDGRTVAAPGHDHMIRLWNVTDPTDPKLWSKPLSNPDVVYAVAFRRDSKLMASVGNDQKVRLWDVSSPAHAKPLGQPLTGHTGTLLAVAFSPDGRTLATAGADHTIRLWDVSDPQHPALLGQPLIGHTGFVNWLAFSPDGQSLASVSDDHTVRLWHLPRAVLAGHLGSVTGIAYRGDGRVLASASAGRVRLWDVRDPAGGRQLSELPDQHLAIRTVFQPQGRLLASADSDGTVWLWDVSAPDRPRQVGLIHTGGADQTDGVLAFTPDGHVLVTGGPRYSLRLWNVTDPVRPAALGSPLTGHISLVHWAGISPDGHTLASTSEDDKVRLWDIRDPARPRPLQDIRTGDTGGTLWGAFSPDGRLLATAGVGHDVRLWNVSAPAHASAIGSSLTGHTDRVTWVGFSADGHTLASAGEDRSVLLWDLTDLTRPTPWGRALTAGHTEAIETAAYRPDGQLLATAGPDGTIEFTPLGIDQAIRRICASTAGQLTPAQWRDYVRELPYAQPCHA
ncbi:WD40 repeat domain-containing protein [Streptomyces sp. RS10V-4]|uniref:nSTAND1 domain-containing NTPase n=1 Tax=Streptomyces rhizoryzae TaxID=2932493 RepID=UPI002004FCB6|nr:helix-turn-helix domain-containing protein [Streptomyces rhizoryzae]MCK7627977.1 WD40 repeat domain-containing protein [Streptomyces rhizoryzae]